MPPEDQGSVTRWIDELKGGDPAAAQPLWDRYYERLVRLARTKLREARRPGGDAPGCITMREAEERYRRSQVCTARNSAESLPLFETP